MNEKIKQTIENLKALKLDDDSHENLSNLCSALYGGKPDFGWTKGACEWLRQALVGVFEQLDPSEWSDSYLAEQGLMRLPVDADGEYIHIGDEMDFSEGVRGLTVIGVGTSSINDSDMGALIRDDDGYTWFNARFLRHHHKPTVEEILREYGDEVRACCDTEDTIAEYAAKLRELMADE